MGLRRVVVLAGVVALLIASSPEAKATTATIVRAVGYCSVDGVVVGESGGCPIDSHKVTGVATATARGDVTASTFAIGASAQANRYVPLGRSASSIIELHSNEVTGKAGPVKIVLSNLSGRSTRQCPGVVCAALGRTSAETFVWAQLYVKGSTSNTPQIVCPVTWSGETAPPRLVIPDDCSPT